MRIVYNKNSGAVLAAAQFNDGDQIINPSAIAIFPLFNASYHASFTVNSGLPTDLIPNYLNYMVDSVVSPTTVIPKNHIQLVPTSTTMVADGKSINYITANILNSSNVGVNGTFNLAINTKSVFAQQNTLQTTGTPSIGSFTVISGVVTDTATVQAVDTNTDPVTGVPGLLPSNLVTIQLAPSGAIQSPLDSSGQSNVRTASILFNDGVDQVIGMSNIAVDGTPHMANEPEGAMTWYSCSGISIAGVKSTTLSQIRGNNIRSLFVRFKTQLIAVQRWWIGFFSVAPMATDTPNSCVGFRYSGGVDGGWMAYYNVGGGSYVTIPTGVPIASDTLYEMKITYNPNLNGGTLTWIINGVAVASVPNCAGAGIFNGQVLGITAEVNNIDGSTGVGVELSAVEMQYQ
jgi:hypothetical protein